MLKRFFWLFFSCISTLTVCMAQESGITNASSSPYFGEKRLIKEVGVLLQKKCESDEFSGGILIAKNNEILFESVCGEASKRYHIPNNLETKFNIASLGKMFTAVAIAQLVETGRLSYDDKIGKFLDSSWLPAKVSNRITIAQLLNHTSGLPEFLASAKARASSRALYRELEDMKPFLGGLTPSFQPGTRYSYSNTGYFLLGAIIEKLSGENYFSYVRQHIYLVAGMNNSDSYALDDPVENLAMGYMSVQRTSMRRQESSFEGLLRGSSFGCGYSTLHDLLRFSEALKNGSLIKAESIKTLWKNHTPENATKAYGYGFELRTGDAGRVVGHSGQFPGVAAKFDLYQDRGYIVIMLSNYELNFPMSGKIEDLIARLQAQEPTQEDIVRRTTAQQ